MKKYLVVLAALAMVLVGCKDKEKEGGSEYTKISFKQSELSIGLGETAKLTVLYEPTTLDAPSLTWSSSAPEIVSVNNGNIEALGIGEANITAKINDLTAVCKVTVQDPFELIQWGGFSLWNLDKTDILSDDTLEATLSTGQKVKCVMVSATYCIWDDNIVMDPETYDMMGTGLWIDAPGTVWLITDSLDKQGPNFYYLGSGSLEIVDYDKFNKNDTAFANCIPAGKLGDAAGHLAWLNDESKKIEDVTEIKGAFINVLAWSSEGGKYEGLFYGIAGPSIFVEDRETSEILYRANMSWWLEDDVAYGLKFVEGEDGKWSPKEPAEWGVLTPYSYEYLGAQEAPKYTAKAPIQHRQTLPSKKNLPTNVLIKK
jgi:hypothetical protein